MNLLEKFLDNISLNKNNYNNTNKLMKKDIEQYLLFVETNNYNLKDIDTNIFSQYIVQLKVKYKINSISKKLSSIKSFYLFLYQNKILDNFIDFNLIEKNLRKSNIEILKNNNEKNIVKSINLKNNFDNLERNFKNDRIKLILELLNDYNIDILNLQFLETKLVLDYNFQKIIIQRENKIFKYDLEKKSQEKLKEFYNLYRKNNFLFFLNENEKNIYNILKKYNIEINNFKKNLKLNDNDLTKKIKEAYFKIGIGDD